MMGHQLSVVLDQNAVCVREGEQSRGLFLKRHIIAPGVLSGWRVFWCLLLCFGHLIVV
jgi:hypothetical protein